jgi:predicted transcriptional regulator
MLSADEKKDLFAKISEKRKEISQLQQELNSVNDKKEEFFKKKTELSNKIGLLIDEIREQTTRNSLTEQVKKEKKKEIS